MLKRLFGWLFSRSEIFDIYKPRERLIYKYFNGKEEIAADPLTLWKKVMAVGPEMSIDIQVSQSPMKNAPEAHTELLSKIRGIFTVTPLNEKGEGLSELETVELLNHFLIYSERLKKNTSPYATSSSNSEVSAVSSGDGPVTRNTSDSGSTENVPSTENPIPPPSEPLPPSVPLN